MKGEGEMKTQAELAEMVAAIRGEGVTSEEQFDRLSIVQEAAFSTKRYEALVAEVLESLDEMKRKIEREFEDRRDEERKLTVSAVYLAAKVQHILAWGMANMNLDGLIEEAGRCDRAQAKAKEA